jgi:hypothetical protein
MPALAPVTTHADPFSLGSMPNLFYGRARDPRA